MEMRTTWLSLQAALAAIGSWVGGVLGGMDGFVYALIAFVVADYITGVMCAALERKLSSEVGFRGIFKKITIFAMVAVGHMIDTNIIVPTGYVGDFSAIRTAVTFFYISNEGLSMLENASRLGLPIPEKLKDTLAMLYRKNKKESTDENSD